MPIIAIVLFYIILQMSCVWGLYRILKNPSVVDASWSIGLMVSGLMYLSASVITLRSNLISGLLVLWALRLSGFLWYTRVRNGHIDKRYMALSDGWKISQSLGFFLNFQLQGALIFIISFIFYWIGLSAYSNLDAMDWVAVIVIIVGILGETLADLQLYRFKKNYPGQVCNKGLWKYSRHPNYFFDWCTWLGFALFALPSRYGILSFISLMALYIIFTQITGPLTERGSIQSRGQKYLDYQKQTSMFFPWFNNKD